MKYITGIAVATACILGLMLCPDAKSAPKPTVVDYAVGMCSTQVATNMMRYTEADTKACALTIIENVQKFTRLPKNPLRLAWVNNATSYCNTTVDVYNKQYCLFLLNAVTEYASQEAL